MPDRSIPTYTIPETLPTDPMLADLVPEFIEQWLTDLSVTWPQIRASGSIDDFRRFGHTIKGSFLQFGFRELSAVGKEIMHDADAGDWDAAEARVIGLGNVLTEVKRRLDAGTYTS